MRVARLVAAIVGVAAVLSCQEATWLRPVSRLTVPEAHVVAADVTADGTLLVTVDQQRVVRVFTLSPKRRLREFTLPEGVDAEAARIAANDATLVVPASADKPAIAMSLADGKPVTPVPGLPTAAAVVPAALRDTDPPETRNLRVSRDGKVATFRCHDTCLLWSGDGLCELNTRTVDARLTGDGKFAVVTQTDAVVVVQATGGDAWSIPGVGLAIPFGDASRFVAIDSTSVLVVDASTQKIESRVPVEKLGFTAGHGSLLAASPDGERLVARWWLPKDTKSTAWRLDLGNVTAQRLPCEPLFAQAVHEGFVLLTGLPGPCSSLHGAQWTWLADSAAAPFAALPTTPAQISSMPTSPPAAVPGRGEVVAACDADDSDGRLARIEASTGRVLALQPAPEPPKEGGTRFASIWSPLVVAGHVVDTSFGGTDTTSEEYRVELRRFDDLSLMASAKPPSGFGGIPYVTAARNAPRLLFWFEEKLAVYDFVPPPDARKK